MAYSQEHVDKLRKEIERLREELADTQRALMESGEVNARLAWELRKARG